MPILNRNQEREVARHPLFNRLRAMIVHDAKASDVKKFDDATAKVMAAGFPLGQIVAVLLPIILSLLGGGKLDIQAVITAILSLLTPKTE